MENVGTILDLSQVCGSTKGYFRGRSSKSERML